MRWWVISGRGRGMHRRLTRLDRIWVTDRSCQRSGSTGLQREHGPWVMSSGLRERCGNNVALLPDGIYL